MFDGRGAGSAYKPDRSDQGFSVSYGVYSKLPMKQSPSFIIFPADQTSSKFIAEQLAPHLAFRKLVSGTPTVRVVKAQGIWDLLRCGD
jgi:hypothetical protein